MELLSDTAAPQGGVCVACFGLYWSVSPESRYNLTGIVVEGCRLNQALTLKTQDLREGLLDGHSAGAARQVEGTGHKDGVAFPRCDEAFDPHIAPNLPHFMEEGSNAF